MYRVVLDTRGFKSGNRRGWQRQLMNDFAVAIDGKEFICKSELDLHNRISFMAGRAYSSRNAESMLSLLDVYDKNASNFFYLESDKYGKQKLKYGLYGSALGYVDLDRVIEEVNKKGSKTLNFNDFYDIRQGDFFKGCKLKIEKIG